MLNQLELTATVEREEILRRTPAGLAVVEVWLKHQSRQKSSGLERDVVCEIQAVLLGDLATLMAGKLEGQQVACKGFLCQRSLRNPRLVLHIEHVEFVKG